MRIDKLLKGIPSLGYRYTRERLEDFLAKMSESTYKSVKMLGRISPGLYYIEFEKGTRYSMKTIYGPRVYDLRELESICSEFVRVTNKVLQEFDMVYVRNPWKIQYIYPSHLDMYTLDYTENPSEGYWIIAGEFRGVNNSDFS